MKFTTKGKHNPMTPPKNKSDEFGLFNELEQVTISERKNMLMEQYKLYIEIMDRVSERRHNANSFFLTINTALVSALTAFLSITQSGTVHHYWIVIACIAGVIFCLTWKRLIESYRQLNAGKFVIIHEMERKLPAKLFTAEWEALGRGDGEKYTPFTKTETYVPLSFILLYMLSAIIVIIQYII